MSGEFKNTVFLMSIHRISENIYCVMLLLILHTTLEKVQKPGIPDPSVRPSPTLQTLSLPPLFLRHCLDRAGVPSLRKGVLSAGVLWCKPLSSSQ